MSRNIPSTCPDDAVLLALPGELDAAAARALEAHLAVCAACRTSREALVAVDEILAEPSEHPPGLEARILSRAEALAPRGWRGRVAPVVAAAGAAAVVLLLLRAGARDPSDLHARSGDALPVLTAGSPEGGPPPTADEAAPGIPNPEVAVAGMAALHNLARGEAAAPAREALLRLRALARRESLPVLVSALAREDRRREAVLALAALRDERAVPALVPWLEDAALASDVRDALATIGGPEAVRALGEGASRTSPDAAGPWVEAIARADGAAGTQALLDLGAREGYGPLVRQALRSREAQVLPHLLDLARGPHGTHAERALAELEALAPPSAVPALAGLLESRDRRARAAQVLARIDTPAAAAALWASAHHAEVRTAFRRGGPATETWLIGRLDRGPVRDRLRAVDLLGLCGGPGAVPGLGALAADPATAPQAIAALGRIGGEAAVRALERIAARPPHRRAAVEALGFTGDPSAIEALERIGSEDRALRDVAIAALARLPAPEAIAAIVRLDRGEGPRGTTIRALRGVGREALCTALFALLEGPLAAEARRTLDAVGGCPPQGQTSRLRY